MSIAVELERLREHIDTFATAPYLMTVSGEGRSHVVSVHVDVTDSALVMPGGNTTRANLAANPAATLLWSAPAGADYCLIVDGTFTVDGETVAMTPTRAVLHRVAGASADLPSCITI